MAPARQKHVVLVGALYLDTILRQAGPSSYAIALAERQRIRDQRVNSVAFYPEPDSKLRATSRQVRRGGNCPNTLEVLQQLLSHNQEPDAAVHLVASLPQQDSPAVAQIRRSFAAAAAPQDQQHHRDVPEELARSETTTVSAATEHSAGRPR